jgi:hypothetical protein
MTDKTTEAVLTVTLGFGWIAGFVIANGFWSTLFCILPFWAWYLSIEKILQAFGMV